MIETEDEKRRYIQFYLTPEQAAWLDAQNARTRLPRSTILRALLDDARERRAKLGLRTRKKKEA